MKTVLMTTGIIMTLGTQCYASNINEDQLTYPQGYVAQHLTEDQQSLSSFEKIVQVLQKNDANFRVVEHEPEGKSDLIAKIRGNDPNQAAKAMLTVANITKQEKVFTLAVLPGNRSVDFSQIFEGKKSSMASLDAMEELTGCKPGCVPPFSFSKKLRVIMDPELQKHKEIVFNAGRLDRSIFLNTNDYIKLVRPILRKITK